MNADPLNPRQVLEASLTALLLGELPPEQAEALRALIAHDQELARLHDRLKHAIDLVRETETSPVPEPASQPTPLRLSDARRQALLQKFKTVEPKEFSKPVRRQRQFAWLVPVAALLLVSAVLSAMLLPALSRSKSKSMGAQRLSMYDRMLTLSDQSSDGTERADIDELHAAERSRLARPAPGRSPASQEPVVVFQNRVASSQTPPASSPVPLRAPAPIVLPVSEPPSSTPATVYSLQVQGFGGTGGTGPTKRVSDDALAWTTHSKQGELGLSSGEARVSLPQLRPALPNSGEAGGKDFSVSTASEADSAFQRRYGLAGRVGGIDPQSSVKEEPTDAPTGQFGALGDSGGTPLRAQAAAPAASVVLPTASDELITSGLRASVNASGAIVASGGTVPSLNGAAASAAGQGFQAGTPLADVPTTGRLFRGEPKTPAAKPQDFASAARANGDVVNAGTITATNYLAYSFDTGASSAAPTALQDVFKSADRTANDLDGIQPRERSIVSAGAVDAGKSTIVLPAASPPSGTGVATITADQQSRNLLVIADAKAPDQIVRRLAEGKEIPAQEAAANERVLDQQKVPQSAHYQEAKRQLNEAEKFQEVLKAKIVQEKADLELPKSSMVVIVDRAEAGTTRRALTGGATSTARVKAERDHSDIAGLTGGQETGSYDPYFVQTEAEAIKSDDVLGRVAKKLNPDEPKNQVGAEGSSNESVRKLRRMVDVRPVKKTDLLEIRAKSAKPEEAAKIANAVAEAYQDYRVDQRRKLTEALKESLAESEAKVAAARKRVDDLRKQLGIPAAVVSEIPPAQMGQNAIPGAAQSPVVEKEPDLAKKPVATPETPVPQPEVQTRDNAFSTFSLNVSDVSFKLAAASLEKGVLPDPAGIRSEEFINAFDYRDPEPAPGAPIAFAWERARYPFAQNRDLLRFSLKTAAQGRQPGRPLNIVLLLDNSGSMERADRVRIIHEALRVLAAQLQPQDIFSVVTFARTARLWVDGVPGNQAGQVAEEVSGLTPQGGTNLEEAMKLAYATALRHYQANGINRVVLLTDGAANLGEVDPEALKKKVEDYRKQGIALDSFGIGWEGYNDDLLEVLTRNGDGRYGFINTPEEAATEFAGQLAGALQVAASDVKVQVEFNPQRVTAYRQVGYAKHQLTKEQFRDNTVDAAEIGAAESGNALYVLEVNPAGSGPLGTARVRYKIPGTTEYREQAWVVPYNGSAPALAAAGPALRLAGAAAAFAEWLAGSPFAAEVTPDALLATLSGVPQVYGPDARPGKLEWMLRQAKSVAGK